jgi:hypothetical protein
MKTYLVNKALEDTRTGDGVGGYVMNRGRLQALLFLESEVRSWLA